jgi:hypothetical protein
MSDDDGHNYIIPSNEEAEFIRWVVAAPYWDNYKGKEYDNNRIDNTNAWTFIDPQEDL